MDKSLEVIDIKKEPTDSKISGHLEIPIKMQLYSINHDSDCLVQSEIHIKAEPQDDGSEFPAIAGTSCGMYPIDNNKVETEEPMIKLESDELMQDPLDIDGEIKVKEHLPINLSQIESDIKIEPTEGENTEKLLESDEDSDSHGSASNLQDQLLNRNDSNYNLYFHTGEKPFACGICKKSFNIKGSLDRHKLIHSAGKPHVCGVCKKVFNQKSDLNRHKLIHGGVKPFSCDVCGTSFARGDYLVKHKRLHTGDKPYACCQCNKAFKQKISLTQHRRLHTGEKPYSCDTCNKSFAQQQGFSQHKRIHKH